MDDNDRLLTQTDVAAWLGVPARTLGQWRYRRVGPLRIGRHVRYRPEDIYAWLDEQVVDPRTLRSSEPRR